MVGRSNEVFHGVPMAALRTKLNVPAARSTLIPRGRLIDRLREARERPPQLFLISAPAGYGKTTLVADWLRTCDDRRAWINLDSGDNDPIRFFQYLILALARIDERIGVTAFDLLIAPTGNEYSKVLETLLSDITESGSRFVLVLDDYHTITNAEIHEFLRAFIDQQPENLDIVIITREDPPFSLSRLRTHDRVTDIRVGDLKLSFEDTKLFLQSDLEFKIDEDIAAGLFSRTEGWLAGIKLAAHSLQGRDRETAIHSLRTFSGSDRYVVEYFADEVVRNLPSDVADFLFKTAFLSQINIDLANYVTGTQNADRILSYLANESLFVYSSDAEEGWYRYHPLFAEYLMARRGGAPDRDARLAAVEWFRKRGMYLDSIRYAIELSEYAEATRIIEQGAISLIELGRSSTLLRWIEALPYDEIERTPKVLVHRAWALLFCDRLIEADEAAGQLIERGGIESDVPCSIFILQALINERLSRNADIEVLRRALAACTPHDAFFRLHGLLLMAKLLFFSGKWSDASEAASAALDIAGGISNRFYWACAEHILAYCRLAQGDRSGSELICERILHIEATTENTFSDMSLPPLATCRLTTGDYESAKEIAGRIAPDGPIGTATPYLVDDGSWIRSRLSLPHRGYLETSSSAKKIRTERWKTLESLISDIPDVEGRSAIDARQAYDGNLIEALSRREIDVIEGIATGMSNTEIGEKLFISVGTVKWHINNIFGKMGVKNRTSAINRARELNIIA